MRVWSAVDSLHRFRETQGSVTFEVNDGRAESIDRAADPGMAMVAARQR